VRLREGARIDGDVSKGSDIARSMPPADTGRDPTVRQSCIPAP
jgi:hypothetical protein